MKKIMIIMLIFVAFAGHAEWLECEFTFQVGWIPNGNIDFYIPDPTVITLENSFDAVFKIDAKVFNLIKIGGNVTTIFSKSSYETADFFTFWPTGMTYGFHIGIEPIQGITFIFEHSCSHPVSAYFSDSLAGKGDMIFDQSYNRIFLELKGKLNY